MQARLTGVGVPLRWAPRFSLRILFFHQNRETPMTRLLRCAWGKRGNEEGAGVATAGKLAALRRAL